MKMHDLLDEIARLIGEEPDRPWLKDYVIDLVDEAWRNVKEGKT